MLNEIQTEDISYSTMKQMLYNTLKFQKFLAKKYLDANGEKLNISEPIRNKYLCYLILNLKVRMERLRTFAPHITHLY